MLDVALQLGEELGVEDDAVLDDLGQAAAELAVRQGPQGLGVDPDADRLVERADDVLGAGMIDADLAADRAVDLRQQGRRNHDQGEPAGECGGDEAGEVADHAAAQGDDQRMAIGLASHQLVVQPGGLVERLAALAGGNDRERRLDAELRTRRPDTAAGKGSSARFESVTISADRHDRPAQVRSSAARTNGPRLVGLAGHDPHLVRAWTELHGYGDLGRRRVSNPS